MLSGTEMIFMNSSMETTDDTQNKINEIKVIQEEYNHCSDDNRKLELGAELWGVHYKLGDYYSNIGEARLALKEFQAAHRLNDYMDIYNVTLLHIAVAVEYEAVDNYIEALSHYQIVEKNYQEVDGLEDGNMSALLQSIGRCYDEINEDFKCSSQ
jgi:tetratricopeptide (TPR) repeat protein